MATRILVIEDSAVEREHLVNLLRNQSYHVDAVENGQEALNYLRNQLSPDIILLDMMLPVLDGWAFLTELHKRKLTPRVIVATGAMTIGREWAAAHGCGFLRKPFLVDDVVAEIQKCLPPS